MAHALLLVLVPTWTFSSTSYVHVVVPGQLSVNGVSMAWKPEPTVAPLKEPWMTVLTSFLVALIWAGWLLPVGLAASVWPAWAAVPITPHAMIVPAMRA